MSEPPENDQSTHVDTQRTSSNTFSEVIRIQEEEKL